MSLLLSAQPGELRAAWIEDRRLVDLLIQRDDHPSLLGDIYLGRVTALDRGLGAAFVDLGLGRDGILPLREAPGGKLTEGAAVIVRVLRDPSRDKGARLTARLIAPPPDLEARASGAKPPRRLVRGSDPLARVLTERTPPREILVDDAETYAALKSRIASVRPELERVLRLDLDPEPLFERPYLADGGVEAAIEGLLDPRVALPGGGALWIEPTHGLVAIDVDSGRQDAGGPQAVARAVDLEAAAEIPRQLRLRCLSGQIVIDFLELSASEDRKRVVAVLRASVKADREPGRIEAMSRSGLVEMTRRRGAPALHEILTAPCGQDGGGRTKTGATLAFEALREVKRAAAVQPGAGITLRVQADVLAALDGPAKAARDRLESRLGRPLDTVGEAKREERGYQVVLDQARTRR